MVKKVLLIIPLCISFVFSQESERKVKIEIEELSRGFANLKYDKATNALADKILELDSSNSQALWYKGVAQQYLSGAEEGLYWLNKFFVLRPNSKMYSYRAQLKMLDKDNYGAIDDIEKALSLSGNDEDALRAAAEIYRLTNNKAKSFLYYEKATKFSNRSLLIYSSYITALIAENKLQMAFEVCEEGIKKLNGDVFLSRFENVTLFVLMANLCIELKKHDEGILAASEAILINPNNAANYRLRARCYLASGNMELACADYAQMKIIDKNIVMRESINCAEGSKYRFSKEWVKKLESNEYFLKGLETKSNINNIPEAIKYFTKCIKSDPTNYHAFSNRAICYLALKKYKEALSDINASLKIYPQSYKLFNLKMHTNMKLKDFKEALYSADKAIELNPYNTDCYVDRSQIKMIMLDSIGAINDLASALELNINDTYAYNMLGFLEMTVRKDFKKASKYFELAIEKELDDPFATKSPKYYHDYSCALDKLGDYKRALEYNEIAIACDPKNPIYYLKSGELNAKLKDMKKACQEWYYAKELGLSEAKSLIIYNCKD